MTSTPSDSSNLLIRLCHRRDLDELERLLADEAGLDEGAEEGQSLKQVRRWYGLIRGLSLFPNPLQHLFCTYVAEQNNRIRGMIQVSPFNRTRSTWRVERVVVDGTPPTEPGESLPIDVGSQLLRFCLQAIWEARTWLIEIDVNDNAVIGLARQNGFQPLARMTYWELAPELLAELAAQEPDLPNLLPVSNADAGLLHQLDTFSMPPHVRQVFDRHIVDFRTGFLNGVTRGLSSWFQNTEVVSGYVFEPQRKAAIAYFRLTLCRDGSHAHEGELTVHPEYTWLYSELLAQMARVAQAFPTQPLRIASADYHQEREEFLEKIGAVRTEHTLMMSRSVWHKVRETKPLEALQLTEMLQGLQATRKPVPSRFSFLDSLGMSQFQPQVDGSQPSNGKAKAPRPTSDDLRSNPSGGSLESSGDRPG